MSPHRIILALCFLFFSLEIFAQGEANYWYFGNNAGLDFSSGAPLAITNGQVVTYEGCAAISTTEGELLFYTDGSLVWNKNHQVVTNGSGLMGHNSSTQSAIIVPNPVHDHLYYIFTVDAEENSLQNGLRYSVYDMTLNGGLGNVTAEKNILLIDPTCEKVTAVKHGSENKFWVVTHMWTNNKFYSYLVDENGVNTNPVISAVGDPVVGTYESAKGYLKISPDGNWLVMANNYMDNVLIFNFNNLTGEVSNQIKDDRFADESKPYGVEFSPNSQILYITNWGWFGDTTRLYQYNLALPNALDILNSRIIISEYLELFGAIQLGPDNKIYMANAQDYYLGVINQPNIYGTGCDFNRSGLYLGGKMSNWGLPPFIQSFFNVVVDFDFENLCLEDETQFFENSSLDPDSVLWNFGDPASGPDNYSNLFDPIHVFTAPGNYNVRLYAFFDNQIDSTSKTIIINSLPAPDLGNDTSFCEGNSYTLDAGSGFDSYLWQNGNTSQNIVTDSGGIFWVEVSNEFGCIKRDSIVLNLVPEIYIQDNTGICQGDSIFLGGSFQHTSGVYLDTLNSVYGCDSITETTLTVNDTFYIQNLVSICTGDSVWAGGGWQFQSGIFYDTWFSTDGCDSTIITELIVDDIIQVNITEDICEGDSVFASGQWQTESGIYQDTVISVMGCDSITTVQLTVHPAYNIQSDTSICEGDSVYLGNMYQSMAGTYQDSYITVYGCDSIVVTGLSIDSAPFVNLGNDTTLASGNEFELNAYSPGATYLWQDGSTESYYIVSAGGAYDVTVSNRCGSMSDTILIVFDEFSCQTSVPNAFTPDDDGLNDIFIPLFNCNISEYELIIFNRWGGIVFRTENPGEGWKGIIDGKPAPEGVYTWILSYRSDNINNLDLQKEKGSVLLLR